MPGPDLSFPGVASEGAALGVRAPGMRGPLAPAEGGEGLGAPPLGLWGKIGEGAEGAWLWL